MGYGLILFPRSTPQGADSAFQWWIDSATSVGLRVRVAFFEDITLRINDRTRTAVIAGEEVSQPDFVVMRGYCTPLSEFFEQQGITVINSSRSMIVSRDKLLTHIALSDAGIPTPCSVWSAVAPTYAEACRMIGSQCFVIKKRKSSKGENVWLATDRPSYDKAVEGWEGDILIQKYVKSSHGRDIRVWVIGGETVGAVMRYSDKDFRSNFALGGEAALYEPPHEACLLAEAAARAAGLFFAGVDLLFTETGFTVCEVNGNAGFRTLSASGGPDILKLFFKTLHDYRPEISCRS